MKEFPTWMVLNLGVWKTIDACKDAYQKADLDCGSWKNHALKIGTRRRKTASFDLVLLKPDEDLGLKADATIKEICDVAEAHGLRPLPKDCGPALAYQYLRDRAVSHDHLLVLVEDAPDPRFHNWDLQFWAQGRGETVIYRPLWFWKWRAAQGYGHMGRHGVVLQKSV